MCTSPIEVKKILPTAKVRTYLVPCGKCSECRKAYQSEFAALCSIEADKDQSLAFFTLTYNNCNLPVAISEFCSETGEPLIVGFQRSGTGEQIASWSDGCRLFRDSEFHFVAPSLYREDVKNWFKKFRSYCDRNDILKLFHFACFGEYGEVHSRPHYHCLVTGLSNEQARIFQNMWTFGFADLKIIPRFNRDGTDAFVLTSNYVSKYISKRDKLPSYVKDGFAQLPRRQTSIGFGSLTDEQLDKLRPFLSCAGLSTPSCD